MAACSNADAPATPEGGITYVVPTSWAGVPALTETVDAYNAESDVDVVVQAVPDENYNSVVGSRLAGGSDIDIFAGAYTLFDVPNVMVDLSGEDFTSRMPEASLESIRLAA